MNVQILAEMIKKGEIESTNDIRCDGNFLKPCPGCKSKKVVDIFYDETGFCVKCFKCGIQGPTLYAHSLGNMNGRSRRDHLSETNNMIIKLWNDMPR